MNEASSERTSYSLATEKEASQNEWNLCRLREDIQSLPKMAFFQKMYSVERRAVAWNVKENFTSWLPYC